MKRGYNQAVKVDYSTSLNVEEDIVLGEKARNGDVKAFIDLQRKHLRFAALAAVQCSSGSNIPFEDLFQESAIGLNRAARNYDPDRGFKLLTSGARIIFQHLTAYIMANGKAVGLPRYLREETRDMRIFLKKYKRDRDGEPDVKDVMAYFQIKEEKARGMMERFVINTNRWSSLGNERDFSVDLSEGDLVEDCEVAIFRDQILTMCKRKIFDSFPGSFYYKQRAWIVFAGRYGFNEKMEFKEQKELALQFGVSTTMIGAIESKVLELLKKDGKIRSALSDMKP